MIYVRKKRKKKIVSSEYQGSFIHSRGYAVFCLLIHLSIYSLSTHLSIYASNCISIYFTIPIFLSPYLSICSFLSVFNEGKCVFFCCCSFFCSPRRETGHPCWVWRHWVGQVWVKSKILQWDVESKIKTEDVSVEITLISELILSQIWMIYSSNRH